MKLLDCIVFFGGGVSISQAADATAGRQTGGKSAKAEAPEKPLTEIPASAVQIEPGAYRYTDAKGKKWILFQTPFGIAKKEDTGEPLRQKLQEDHEHAGREDHRRWRQPEVRARRAVRHV